MRIDEAKLKNLINRTVDERIEEYGKVFDKCLNSINSEKFIDEVVERIKKKQLK